MLLPCWVSARGEGLAYGVTTEGLPKSNKGEVGLLLGLRGCPVRMMVFETEKGGVGVRVTSPCCWPLFGGVISLSLQSPGNWQREVNGPPSFSLHVYSCSLHRTLGNMLKTRTVLRGGEKTPTLLPWHAVACTMTSNTNM